MLRSFRLFKGRWSVKGRRIDRLSSICPTTRGVAKSEGWCGKQFLSVETERTAGRKGSEQRTLDSRKPGRDRTMRAPNVTAGCPTLVHSRHSPRNIREPVSLHGLYTAESCSLLPNYTVIVCQRCDERERRGIRQADRYCRGVQLDATRKG